MSFLYKKEENNIISNFIWSLKELCKFKKTYVFFMGFGAVIRGIMPVISLILVQQMIDIVQFQSGSLRDVISILIALSVFELLCETCLNYTQLKLDNYELEFEAHFQTQILDKISVLDSKDFENSKTYDLINRTQYDANMGILGNIKTFFSLAALLISTVSYMLIMIKYSILLFGIVIVPPVVRYFFEKKYNLLEYDTEKKNTEPERRASYISYLLTNAENFKEIKMFKLFGFFIHRFTSIKACCNLDFIKLHKKRAITYSILSIFETVVDCLVTLAILIQTFNQVLSIGKFVLYNNSIDNLKANLVEIFSQLSLLYKNSAMIEQVRTFYEMAQEDINEDGVEVDEIKSVRLDNVSYRYHEDGAYTLKNISFALERGEFTVVMGYNGSGKSTLMKIIMGIYNDYEGDIYVNNVNRKFVNMDDYRQKIGVLFQDYIKYESSISDNIGYGNLMVRDDDKTIDAILEKVNLETFVKTKDQQLGYQFHDGIQMSIGQWQKLALGRTLLSNSDVYIFDEPNASLDLVSENAILSTIYNEMKDKITLLIMHRFNRMVEKANKIVVLHEGKIAEMGTHNELLKNRGLYYELNSIQKKIGLSTVDSGIIVEE